MKKALVKDSIRQIKNTFKRFLSIVLIVFLGVGFFAGIRATSPDMKDTVDTYYDLQDVMDIEVLSTLGLTQNDIEALKDVEGINEVEGSYSFDATVSNEEKEFVIKVKAMPENINKIKLMNGNLPQNSDEAVVEESFLIGTGYKIGDYIELTPEKLELGQDESTDVINEKKIKIVGVVESPEYISRSRGTSKLGAGSINYYMFIPRENINMDVYTLAYITVDGAKELATYNQDYKDLVSHVKDNVEAISDERKQARYNEIIEEANKKIQDIFGRLNVLNVEDSLFELKTMHDYFDSLYADFDKERYSKKIYEDYSRSILIKATKLEKVNNELYKKIGDIKYSYDLTDDEVSVISEIKDEIMNIRASYDKVVDIARSKTLAYSKLAREMEIINSRLVKTEEKLNGALKTLGSLKEDELRAREQLEEIKRILSQTKEKIRSYKLPIVPKNYYVEMSEAMEAINELVKELDKRPISIKILNLRVDTARDLVLKVYNTVNETVKTAKMAETAIVYGNRYRVTNKEVDFGLIKAENAFFKGNFKNSLENAINAINIVEPGIHKKLLEESQS